MELLLSFISGFVLGCSIVYIAMNKPFRLDINIEQKQPVKEQTTHSMAELLKEDSQSIREEDVFKEMKTFIEEINETLKAGGDR